MARNNGGKDPSIHQKNDASSINNKRGMARRAKRNSNKRDRQQCDKVLKQCESEVVVTATCNCKRLCHLEVSCDVGDCNLAT